MKVQRTMLGLLAAGLGLLVSTVQADDPVVLTEARDDLRISALTLDRIRGDLLDLLLTEFDPAVVADYADYMRSVRDLTATQRRVVDAIEGVAAELPSSPSSGEFESEIFVPDLPVAKDELDRLEDEFAQSVHDFDAFLLKEQYEAQRRMEAIDEASSEEMSDLAREAAAAVERLRKKGIDVNTSSPPGESPSEGAEGAEQSGAPGEPNEGAPGSEGAEGAESTPGPEGAPGAEGEAGSTGSPSGDDDRAGSGEAGREPGAKPGGEPGGKPGDEPGNTGGGQADPSGSGAGGSGEPGTQPSDPSTPGEGGAESEPVQDEPNKGEPAKGDRPPADDDDIVARQLRQAAERETDPELKEKLWQEYDRYKGRGNS